MSEEATSDARVTRRVVKVGGSLLTMSDLAECFQAWLAVQPTAETLLIAGGGELADAVRETNRLQPLSDAKAHWLCIRAMQLQTEMLAASLSKSQIAPSIAELRSSCPQQRLAIVDPWRFVHEEDPKFSATPLPESWDVTSDSIAARLAQLTSADELVLLKSASAPAAVLPELVAAGYVDRYFSQAVVGIPQVRLVNLRDVRSRDVIIRRTEPSIGQSIG
jgi:5-(aminomethyl)-3-furanmethanol phosphate kinase